MAEAKKAEKAEGGDAEEQAPNKKKKLMLIIIGVVVLALIGAGTAFFLMKKNAAEPPAKTEKAKKAKKEHEEAPPVFVKLDAFTVKLQSDGHEAYLQATPELRVLDAHLGDKIKQYTPEIRHKILLILAGKAAADVSTPQGVQKLSNEMRVTINTIIEPPPARKKGKDKPAEEPADHAEGGRPVAREFQLRQAEAEDRLRRVAGLAAVRPVEPGPQGRKFAPDRQREAALGGAHEASPGRVAQGVKGACPLAPAA